MIQLEKDLLHEIDWRTKELSTIRLTPIKHDLTDEEKLVLEKYSAVAIYSLWEGFVHQSFTFYIRTINDQNLKCNNLHMNVIIHDIDSRCKLHQQRTHKEAKSDLIKFMLKYQGKPVELSTKIPTESNVNLIVLNKILLIFNLERMSDDFKPRLDKLLMIRNKIAHGESGIKVSREVIAELISTVSDSMDALANIIVDGYKNKKSLCTTPIPDSKVKA
jgi:hypothetical protein